MCKGNLIDCLIYEGKGGSSMLFFEWCYVVLLIGVVDETDVDRRYNVDTL